MILLDAAPSNSEMFGFFLVFGGLFLCFLIAKLFGPVHPRVEIVEIIEPRGPVGKAVTIIVIIVILYFVFRGLAIAHQ